MTTTVDAGAPAPNPSDGPRQSADALLAADPRLLRSAERLDLIASLQALEARVVAARMQALVAECGPIPRVREIRIDAAACDPFETRDAERAQRRHGGHILEVTYAPPDTSSRDRIVRLVDTAVDEIAARVHRSPGSVAHELRRARLLHGPLPLTRAAMAAGHLSPAHVARVCEQAARMQATPLGEDAAADARFTATCETFETRVLPIALASTPGRTGSQAERIVVQIDAANQRARRERAKAFIDVTARGIGDGLACITATLPAVSVALAMARIDATAKHRATSQPDPDMTIGQHRADALLALIGSNAEAGLTALPLAGDHSATADQHRNAARDATGEAAGALPTTSALPAARPLAPASAVRVEVQVLVDAAVLAGQVDGVAWVRPARSADLAPVDRTDLLGLLTDPTTPAVFRRLLIDPATGAMVDRGAKTYAPTDELTAWLAARDQGCRFPGCTALAVRCDVDHATDYADGGQTTVVNTGLLCRRHHNAKTHGGWTITDTAADGSCDFISPAGHHYRHGPVSLADLLAGPTSRRQEPPEVPSLSSPPAHSLGRSSGRSPGGSQSPDSAQRCPHHQCPPGSCTAPYGRAPTGEPYPF